MLSARTFQLIVLVVAVLFGTACSPAPLPQLIEVSDMVPHEVESGDRLEFSGAQFPMGKQANVTFRGTLHHAGESPSTHAVVTTKGVVSAPTRIELPFNDELMSKFAGIGEDATHTTFVGEVEVAFASLARGAPPLVATLKDVTLDVRPPEPDAKAFLRHREEGEALLTYIGLHVTSGAGVGLLVDDVAPGSRADLAGVRKGDLITSFDHVRVASTSDIRVGSSRDARLGLLREGSSHEDSVRVFVDGFRDTVPRDVLAAALLLGTMMLTMLLFLAPSRGIMSRMEALTAWRVKHFASGTEGSFVARFAARFRLHLERPIFVGFAALASALIGAMAFGSALSLETLDVALLFSLYAALTIVLTLLRASSFRQRASAAVRLLLAHMTLPLALAGVVSLTGTLDLSHIVRAQGGLPWQANAFRTPPLFLLFVVVLLGQVFAIDVERTADRREDEGERSHELSRAARFPLLLLGSAMIVAVFLGGWMVPGYQHVDVWSIGVRLAAAAIFLVKTWSLAAALLAIQRFVPGFQEAAVVRVALKWLLPLSTVAFLASVGWSRLHLPHTLEGSVATGIFALSVLIGLRFVERVVLAFRSAEVNSAPFV